MASPLERFIGQADTLQQLQAHATRLTRLEALLQRCLPGHLAATCHVANLRETSLVIHAESGAAAAKLRQALPSLLRRLRDEGAQVEDIKVRVKPVEYRPAAPPPTLRQVSAQSRDELDALAASLPPDSPVADALRRLVRHSR